MLGQGFRPLMGLTALAALLLAGAGPADTPAPAKDKERPTNRLARETSPYLLQHAHNPVDWYPWGPEAFAKAKKEGKLIFLSIGYSSCYWCHVMERQSFENPAVAKLLNDWFVCIKVDREERPDIDTIYMTALNALGQRGGWPLSMFLTADGKPIIGGTYWPPDDLQVEGEKMPGFKSVLKLVHDWAANKPAEVQEQADKLARATSEILAGRLRGLALVDLDRSLLTAAVDGLKEEFDKEYGGFGSAARNFKGTKFPSPPSLELLQYVAARDPKADVAPMITLTLDRMARGGIYDQLGGGFHRYSTERTWTVPHFEKMLYDNAQLVRVYARAYGTSHAPPYRRVVQETLVFVSRELTAPEGGFYSALDAETGGEEGRYYVWTDQEIADALGDKADVDLVKKVYGADHGLNFESKYHIFVLPKPLAETAKELKLGEEELAARLAPLRQKLLDARARRSRPFRDTKILTGWNGQMIAGYAVAGQELHEPRYVEAAARAADFVLHTLRTKDGRLLRTFAAQPGQAGVARLNAYLEDYAYLVDGLLSLHDATEETKWLDEAKALTEVMVTFHADNEHGGFFFTSNDHEKLFARSKDQYDGVQPAGNSVAAGNLVRLWAKTGDDRYRALAEKTFRAFAGALKSNPTGLTAMAQHLGEFLDARQARGQVPDLKTQPASGGGAKKSDGVVKIEAKADKPAADGQQTVTFTVTIDKGWHLYANPVPKDFPGIPITVTFEGKNKPQDVKVDYPKGKPVKDPLVGDHEVYEGTIKITAKLRRAKDGTGPLEANVKVQACNKDKCLLPGNVKVMVKE
jgi:uncharacterized protein YyaL (SSP411 family)